MRSIRAAAILLAHIVLLIVGTPGLDFVSSNTMATKQSQQAAREKHGDIIAIPTIALNEFNRKIRRPLAKRLGKFQPVFRIRQSWHLYRDGPRTIRRMEVRIDGTVVYRTLDSRYDWHEAQFRNRRIRPMVESTTKKLKSANWRGLCRYIVNEALEDFPGVREVEIVALSGRRPGKRLGIHHRFVAKAPDWTVERSK